MLMTNGFLLHSQSQCWDFTAKMWGSGKFWDCTTNAWGEGYQGREDEGGSLPRDKPIRGVCVSECLSVCLSSRLLWLQNLAQIYTVNAGTRTLLFLLEQQPSNRIVRVRVRVCVFTLSQTFLECYQIDYQWMPQLMKEHLPLFSFWTQRTWGQFFT